MNATVVEYLVNQHMLGAKLPAWGLIDSVERRFVPLQGVGAAGQVSGVHGGAPVVG